MSNKTEYMMSNKIKYLFGLRINVFGANRYGQTKKTFMANKRKQAKKNKRNSS